MIALPLEALDIIVTGILALALALLITAILRSLAKVLAGVPGIGGWLSSAADRMAQAITWACGKALSGTDKLLGSAWAHLATYFDNLWHQIEAEASVLAQVAGIVGSSLYNVTGLRSLVHHLEQVFHGIEHGVKTLTREFHGIDRRVRRLEREIGQGIGNDLRTQVKALDREVTSIEQGVIPGLRAGVKTAEGEITQLENFIRALPGTRYLDWAAGIVAAGLGSALWNFFKCPTFLGKTLGRGCGFWNALEDIFGLMIDALILANLCDIPVWINDIFGPFEGELVSLVSEAATAVCARPNASWTALGTPALHLPTSAEITQTL